MSGRDAPDDDVLVSHAGEVPLATHAAPDASATPSGPPRRASVKLWLTIPLLVIAAAVVTGLAVAVADYTQASRELRRGVEDKLLALLQARTIAISDYLSSIQRDLRQEASDPLVIEAIARFTEARADVRSRRRGEAPPALRRRESPPGTVAKPAGRCRRRLDLQRGACPLPSPLSRLRRPLRLSRHAARQSRRRCRLLGEEAGRLRERAQRDRKAMASTLHFARRSPMRRAARKSSSTSRPISRPAANRPGSLP